jgi:hypothetical protein
MFKILVVGIIIGALMSDKILPLVDLGYNYLVKYLS